MAFDSNKASAVQKLRKALRYTKLYGLSRTFSKIRGKRHLNRTFEKLPSRKDRNSKRHVGIIGSGNFGYSNLAYYLNKNYGRVIRASMDVDANRAASLFETYDLDYFTIDSADMMADPAIDLIYIASNHATHAEYAIVALESGKSVHIEKPHAVTEDQLKRLCRAMDTSNGAVGIGFNRPDSFIGERIRSALASQSGPMMLNWFVAGHAIAPDHWYFDEGEGGRVLGNLCHWIDMLYQCIEPECRYPILIVPTKSQRPDSDIAVTYTFGDGSTGIITFSEKGDPFEGVRERFSGHRGDVLIFMDDFQSLVVETGPDKRKTRTMFRDHGHEAAVRRSYEAARSADRRASGLPISYVWESGELFLKTKEALDTGQTIRVDAFDSRRVSI